MKAVEQHLFQRGKRGTYYLRRRIPADVLDAYSRRRREVVLSLGTSDRSRAIALLRRKLVELEDEFEARRAALRTRLKNRPPRKVRSLSPAQVDDLAALWLHCVLDTDESSRSGGLDEASFTELGQRIERQRAELGVMLARGNTRPILPAFRSFLQLCGIAASLDRDDEQRAAYAFLKAVVAALDAQAQRQAGGVVPTPAAPPTAHASPNWDDVFAAWRDYVEGRPRATTIVSGLPIIPSCGRRIFPTHQRQGANDGSGSSTGRRAGRELRCTGPEGPVQRGRYGARVAAGHGGAGAWVTAVGGGSRTMVARAEHLGHCP
ncbi:MAG: hypothetical protein N3D71_07565 [Burkholderiaceae bacterium]|nr:hypothetical protein [Burkholderiaceae bacterium]